MKTDETLRKIPVRSTLRKTPARSHAILLLLAALLAAAGLSCMGGDDRPNVLFIVWDTTRADRMSLFGYEKKTTPFLDEWAQGARVFENCTSTGSSTVPAHGAMFTGLLPTEHGANNSFKCLADQHVTLAEIFRDNGYDTYLFSANPHISADENFHQGFDTEEHPWDRKFRDRSVDRAMAARDGGRGQADGARLARNRERAIKMARKRPDNVFIRNSGWMAEEGLREWLADRGGAKKPFFAFLNYMEAHRPYSAAEKYCRKTMTPAQIERLKRIDRSWLTSWKYTFGLHEYSEEDLETFNRLYEACLLELDDLFASLIGALEKEGRLDNTIIVLVADHGEHLGEHHLLDHQYSLYEPLLKVPLVLWWHGHVEPGRETRPVVNFDLFSTLRGMAGLETPSGLPENCISLLEPDGSRLRLAEYPSDLDRPIDDVRKEAPDWDPTPFHRRMVAIYDGRFKLIRASDGTHELYDIDADPLEETNLFSSMTGEADRLHKALLGIMKEIRPFDYDSVEAKGLSEEQRERLEALGYGGGER